MEDKGQRIFDCRFWVFDYGAVQSLRRIVLVSALLLMSSSVMAEQRNAEPSVMHGFGQVVGGVILELPKTVVEATLTGPPVAGTIVGLLAGTARALQKTVGGVVEMATAFDPWGAKRTR